MGFLDSCTVIDIHELKKEFKEHTVVAAVQCCGNRYYNAL